MLQWSDSSAAWLAPLLSYLTAAAMLVLLVWTITRFMRRRRRQRVAWPELLISGGEAAPVPAEGISVLTMTIGNLNPYPVQVLEVAIGTGSVTEAEVAGVNELLGPGRQITLDVQLAGLEPRDGTVDVYFYTTVGKWRHYRVQAGLQWQAWARLHRISLLDQLTDQARELASEQIERHRRQLWKKGRRSARRIVSTLAPADMLPAAPGSRRSRQQLGEVAQGDRLPEVSDFPVDF
jgi:hypothetical protein